MAALVPAKLSFDETDMMKEMCCYRWACMKFGVEQGMRDACRRFRWDGGVC